MLDPDPHDTTAQTKPAPSAHEPAQQPSRPRVALMGEFSAGKSSVANLLLQADLSPVQVTATQLPPIWYRRGAQGAARIDIDGTVEALPPASLTKVDAATTRLISVFRDEEFLDAFELLDMPGTSDPNMVPEFWEPLIPELDLVIWCTPATQAWRQSEAALWSLMPRALQAQSLLLVTRIDMLRDARDRARVLHRVEDECAGLFRKVLPIDLRGALAQRDDMAVLHQTGADALFEFLAEMMEVAGSRERPRSDLAGLQDLRPPLRGAGPAAAVPGVATSQRDTGEKIVPRRVVRKLRTAARPEAPDSRS